MSETGTVKGFKVFNPDWTCNPSGIAKQYACPGKFEEDLVPIQCRKGMHFCKNAADCFNYYSFSPENKVAEVIAYGDIVEEGNKCCTNKLEIVREIPWDELLKIVNVGKNCTGHHNSGDGNSGHHNSGHHNSGHHNGGDYNSGSYNSGDYNSGDRNSGHRNNGDGNSGDYNSGSYNSGDGNSGSYNGGDYNSGNWNKCSFSNGCFNTVSPKIYLFNKPSEWTYQDWLNSEAHRLLNQIPGNVLEYIRLMRMTDEEKAAHPEAETTGGYLKSLNNSECAVSWWRSLSDREKAVITAIPNFDKEIFKQITGIDVDAD